MYEKDASQNIQMNFADILQWPYLQRNFCFVVILDYDIKES